jgi:hypothetical protein
MITNKLLVVLVVGGLIMGCTARVSVSTPAQPSHAPSPSTPSPLPTQTGISVKTVPATEVIQTPADRATFTVPPSIDHQFPPAIDDHLPPTSVETARADLAHRLHTDVSLIKVTEVGLREPDLEVMPCLADLSRYEELWKNLSEIEWIALSVKGNIHHYVAVGDLVLYCDEPVVHE